MIYELRLALCVVFFTLVCLYDKKIVLALEEAIPSLLWRNVANIALMVVAMQVGLYAINLIMLILGVK